MGLREVTTYSAHHGCSWRHQQYVRRGARVRTSMVEPRDADYTDCVLALWDARTPREQESGEWSMVGNQNARDLAILVRAGRLSADDLAQRWGSEVVEPLLARYVGA